MKTTRAILAALSLGALTVAFAGEAKPEKKDAQCQKECCKKGCDKDKSAKTPEASKN